jgi:AAT family amino acid transporter
VGPWLAVILNIVLVLIQGWEAFSPKFDAVDFVSYYIELPIMLVMFVAWKLIKRTRYVRLHEMDLMTDVYVPEEEDSEKVGKPAWQIRLKRIVTSVF